MLLVGLTGGIASGKSTVADLLVHHGADLVDADQIARDVVIPGNPAHTEIVEHFGTAVLDDDGFIDRPALGRIVFGDEAKRAVLNQITHPRIMDEIAAQLELLATTDGVVVLDVPLLVEVGASRDYDAVLVVATHPAVQVERLVRLRGMDVDEARQRVEAQAPLEEKLAAATHVIWNEGTLDEVRDRTDDVYAALSSLAERKRSNEAVVDSAPQQGRKK